MINLSTIKILYNIIFKHIYKEFHTNQNNDTYSISYNYNKEHNTLELSKNYYIQSKNDINAFDIVKISKEEFEILINILINNGFNISHHYIYIEKEKLATNELTNIKIYKREK